MRIIIDDPKKIWFTSDTHYSHKNIVYGVSEWKDLSGTRQFDTIEQMNNQIVSNINKFVGEDDIMFHIGDFAFGNHLNIYEFRRRINCRNIHLILGNHDKHIRKNEIVWDDNGNRPPLYANELFESIQDYLFLSVKFTDDISHRLFLQPNRTQSFVLSHYPMLSWEDMENGSIQLHGHTHLSTESKWGTGRRLDIGVDGNDMKPYNLVTDIMYQMDKCDIIDIYKKK